MAELQKAPWSDWETVRLIGRGSFGTVYEIQRKLVDEDTESAALKVITIPQNPGDVEEMYSEGYDDESITATFNSHLKSIIAEYSLMRKMDGSANIVNCKDIRYIQHDDGIGWDIYIRMELLTPLMKALPVDADEATVIRIGKDICNALVLCKKHEIVHRDIKPQNIFVSSNGDYKLGDFGIAKTVEKTMGGTKIGTYKYMAPEVYNNQPYGSAADIYSLGLVLYWLLNERRMPFMPLPPAKLGAGMDEESRHRRLSGEKLPAPAHGSDELKQIVLKACAYDPKDRYSSAAAMLEDLNKLTGGAAVISPVIIPNVKNDEKQEDDKTTGPVFDTAKKAKVDNIITDDSDATVGPSFAAKSSFAEEKHVETNNTPETISSNEPPKKNILKYILLGLGILLAVVLFLLLRSCSGETPDNKPAGTNTQSTITTEGSSVTPEQLEWSNWTDKLPAGVAADKYEIEEKTLYSSRTQETTSSTEKKTMDGWELFDTVEANGAFGLWSDWSASKADSSATREVEIQTRYRYRDKETTTSSSATKDGWIKYDTTYSWGNYGAWSSWSTSAVSNSDSRKVETKTQYRYRSISYSTQYTSWGSWSSWQDTAVSETDLRDVETRTAYHYYYFICSNCGKHLPGQNLCYSWDGGCGRTNTGGSYTELRLETPYSSTVDFGGVGMRYITVNGDKVFAYTSSSSQYYRAPITQYRYRTRSTQQITNYGSWSSWGDTAYSNSSTRQVETRTVYRYCDRSKVATYHFYRWGGWSNWSENKVSATNDRQVENTTYYRYRDQVKTTTYYFRRWTDWSSYSENPITASETMEVQTKTQYRYKEK